MSRGPSRPQRKLRPLCPTLGIWNLKWAVDIHEAEGLGRSGAALSLYQQSEYSARQGYFLLGCVPLGTVPRGSSPQQMQHSKIHNHLNPPLLQKMGRTVAGLEEKSDKIRSAFWKDTLRSLVHLPLRNLLDQRQLYFWQASFPVSCQGLNFLSPHSKCWERIFHTVKVQNCCYGWVRHFLEQWSHSWPHNFLSPPVPFHWCSSSAPTQVPLPTFITPRSHSEDRRDQWCKNWIFYHFLSLMRMEWKEGSGKHSVQ